MSYDQNDADWDRMLDDIGPEYAEQAFADAIDQFTTERLQSYYLAHPTVLGPAHLALADARGFLAHHPTAACIFAGTAVDVALIGGLIRPFVFGLIHDEDLASIVAENVGDQGMGRLWRVVKALLEARAPNTVNIDDVKEKAWLFRNRAVHTGERIEPEVAAEAVALATTLVEAAVPKLLQSIGLTLDGDRIIQTPTAPLNLFDP